MPDPNWPIVNRDRNLPAQTPAGKSHHIHGTPVYMERATGGIVYVWGENERLKAYNFDFATKRITAFRGPRDAVRVGQHGRARRHAWRTPRRLLEMTRPPSPTWEDTAVGDLP